MERQRNLNETYSMSMVDFKVRVPITSQILTLIATKALTGCAMQPDVVYAVGYSGKQNVINCNKIMPLVLVTFELRIPGEKQRHALHYHWPHLPAD